MIKKLNPNLFTREIHCCEVDYCVYEGLFEILNIKKYAGETKYQFEGYCASDVTIYKPKPLNESQIAVMLFHSDIGKYWGHVSLSVWKLMQDKLHN